MLFYPEWFWFSFKGRKNTDYSVQVIKRPNIPAPKQRINWINIPGRDGDLAEVDGTYENKTIKVEMNFLTDCNRDFMKTSRLISNWLTGTGILKFSDDNDVFYKVKQAKLDTDLTRILKRAGTFSALFTCDPYTYYERGRAINTIEDCLINPYETSHPVYKIRGNGVCTLTVNGHIAQAEISQSATLDTDLMIVYNDLNEPKKLLTRSDYSDFYLQPGENEISITSGFELDIMPNWRSL